MLGAPVLVGRLADSQAVGFPAQVPDLRRAVSSERQPQ